MYRKIPASGMTIILVSVHKVPFTALRSSENYSFTMSKLRIFGLRKPCK